MSLGFQWFFVFFAQCWQALVDIHKCTWILNSRNNNYINPWHLFTNVTLVQLLCKTQICKDVGSGEICSRYGGQYLARATSDNPPALNVSHCQSTSASPISPGAESRPREREHKKCVFSLFSFPVPVKSNSQELCILKYPLPADTEEETEWKSAVWCPVELFHFI